MSDLWPHLPLAAIRLAQTRIAMVTRKVLGPPAMAPLLAAEGETELSALGVAAFQSGMGPLLGYWIERGQLRADEAVVSVLSDHLRHGRYRAAILEWHLVRLLRGLRDRNVTPVVLKGSFTARRYFPEPGTRPVGDIDLLVPPSQFAVAEQILRSGGFEVCGITGRASTWRLAGMDPQIRSVELDHARNPWYVDLHRTLDQRYFRGLWSRYGSTPWENTESWEICGERAWVLSQPLLTAHLAAHASRSIDITRLVRIVELVVVLRRELTAGSLDWEALAAMLHKIGLWRFVYPAFEMSECLAPGLLDPRFRQALTSSATRRCREIVERVVANGFEGWSDRGVDEKLMWSRSPREFALNILEVMFPRGVSAKDLLPLQTKRARLLFRRAA